MALLKITGATVSIGDNHAPIDVDTAVLDLHEELGRTGRQRQYAALGYLINAVSTLIAEEEKRRETVEATEELGEALGKLGPK